MAIVYFGRTSLEVDDAAMCEFGKKFRQISAGGGLVTNDKGEVLMIYRRNMWDLPKGKLEEGESIEDCALREVCEETGLAQLQLKELICTTFHTYKMDGVPCLKHTWWFRMEYTGCDCPTPQLEEDITEARWVAKQDIPQHIEGTFPSIQEVFSRANL